MNRERKGAFVQGVRQKLRQVAPLLHQASAEEVEVLYDALTMVEGTVAMRQAWRRRRDAVAEIQQSQQAGHEMARERRDHE